MTPKEIAVRAILAKLHIAECELTRCTQKMVRDNARGGWTADHDIPFNETHMEILGLLAELYDFSEESEKS